MSAQVITPVVLASWRASDIARRDLQIQFARDHRVDPDCRAAVRMAIRIARDANRQAIHWGRQARGLN